MIDLAQMSYLMLIWGQNCPVNQSRIVLNFVHSLEFVLCMSHRMKGRRFFLISDTQRVSQDI
jgi:hypothetical protein